MLVIRFHAGGWSFAIDSRDVVEVVHRVRAQAVPHAPPGMTGLLIYRGQAIPLLDVSRMIVGRDAQPGLSSRVLLVQVPVGRQQRLVGLLAERVTEVEQLAAEPGHESPARPTSNGAGVATPNSPYFGRVLLDQHGMLQLIDLDRLLPPRLRAELFPDVTEDVPCTT